MMTMRMILCCLALMVGGAFFVPATAKADDTTAPVCTSFTERMAALDSDTSTSGLLSDIYTYVVSVVDTATERLFSAFTENSIYQEAVLAAMALMVTFYGVAFTIGVVQASFAEVVKRLMKIAIIGTLISGTGWDFFNEYVVHFFADGTDEIVKGVMEIGTGMAVPAGATPFYHIDKIASFILQPDTITAVIGSIFSGGPFGAAMGGLLGFAVWSFFMLLINALQTYAMCYVARALVLGVAPIFLVFLLFDKTKTLFQGWLNVLINFSLQPILMFTFLSFFMVMIHSATKNMFGTELCWTEGPAVTGSNNRIAMWHFVDPTTNQADLSMMTWKGPMSCVVNGGTDCPSFPMNIVDVLSFVMLIYIAKQFGGVTQRISTELSNALVTLDQTGRIDQYMQEKTKSLAPGSGGSANQHRGGI